MQTRLCSICVFVFKLSITYKKQKRYINQLNINATEIYSFMRTEATHDKPKYVTIKKLGAHSFACGKFFAT